MAPRQSKATKAHAQAPKTAHKKSRIGKEMTKQARRRLITRKATRGVIRAGMKLR